MTKGWQNRRTDSRTDGCANTRFRIGPHARDASAYRDGYNDV